MNIIRTLTFAMVLFNGTSAIAQDFHVTNVSRERILVDKTYTPDAEALEFLAPYRHIVDSVMSPVVGTSAKYMKSHAPESELSNLLADIIVWGGKLYNERPDIGIYNMGGIRAALPEGTVTMGDIVDIAPFENKLCFLTLTGAQLKVLFQQMTLRGGATSKGVRAEYTANGKELTLTSLTLNGKKVKDKKKYRIATIDYLIQGNDGFREFRNATDFNIPGGNDANAREIIAQYFKEKMAKGEIVDSSIENRVKINTNE